MIKKILPGPICALIALLFYVINTFALGLLVGLPLGILKFLVPIPFVQRLVARGLNWMVYAWGAFTQWHESILVDCEWDIRGVNAINKNEWYLILMNHQSWVDIMAVFEALNGKVPPPKFFIKRELLWLPIIGQAAWICDFPFMRRYSESEIRKDPSKKGKDIEITRKACQKYRAYPISVCSFAEGTRFTPKKHKLKKSPFKHLLRPKAGGVGFVMGSMGDILHQVLDVTIVFPNGKKTFWEYLSGKTKKIVVDVRQRPITEDLVGDYFNDRAYKEHFQKWMNQLWQEKDQLIEQIIQEHNN